MCVLLISTTELTQNKQTKKTKLSCVIELKLHKKKLKETKGLNRSRKSKKDKQYSGTKKRHNDRQHTTQRTYIIRIEEHDPY